MKLTTVWCAALIAAAVPGCKKKDKGEADNSAPKTVPTAPDKGSDMMAGGSATTPPTQAAPAVPATPEAKAKRYLDCWGFWSSKDWTNLTTCYAKQSASETVDSGGPTLTTPDAIVAAHQALAAAFPDRKADVEVTLINGDQGATVALFTGTNSGPMPGSSAPATNKKVGMQVAHVAHFADNGTTVDKDWFYQDAGEMLGQLGLSKAPARAVATKPMQANEIVIAKDDEAEKKNVESAKALMDDFNKRDLKALDALMDDKLVWSEQGMAKDWTSKAETIKAHQGLIKAFSDVKFSSESMWAAGDYVAWQGTLSGTNDGAAPEMGLAKPTKKPITIQFFQLLKYGKDGKLTNSWGFWNSAAMAMQLGLVPPPAPPAKK